jgi:DNA-directed RNA polymerase specialized sigma24 family protein
MVDHVEQTASGRNLARMEAGACVYDGIDTWVLEQALAAYLKRADCSPLDHKIIEELRRGVNASARALAHAIGASERTVRERLRRIREHCMRFLSG